jgi:transketolase
MLANKYKLDHLTAILDYNKFSLTGPIDDVMPLEPLCDKWKAFGWHVIEVDGHSVSELLEALQQARTIKDKPTMIIAQTVKGKGMPNIEGKAESHALTSFSEEEADRILIELSGEK